MKQVVIMPGGFHPFHAGHAALYQSARQAFPGADVYVAATNDTSNRPFPFQVKEKLAQLAGVPKGRFMQVKSPFGAEEILAPYNPDDTQLIFVKSEKNSRTGPSPEGPFPAEPDPATGQLPLVTRGARKGLPVSDRLQYYRPGQPMAPMSRHSYLAYLPTVEFGPGITSGSEIRNIWPKFNEQLKTDLVMSLYPKTQNNPKLAANVVQMLDNAIGTENINVTENIENAKVFQNTRTGKWIAWTMLGKNEIREQGDTKEEALDNLEKTVSNKISTRKNVSGNITTVGFNGPFVSGILRMSGQKFFARFENGKLLISDVSMPGFRPVSNGVPSPVGQFSKNDINAAGLTISSRYDIIPDGNLSNGIQIFNLKHHSDVVDANDRLTRNTPSLTIQMAGRNMEENQVWAATYEADNLATGTGVTGGMHATYQDRYNQPIDERDITSKLGTKRDQGKSVRKWRKERGLDEQEQLSGNIRAVPNADSAHEWDYYYKDQLIEPGTDIHSKVKDLHFNQQYPGYLDAKDAISNAFSNPIKPSAAVPANKWPENQSGADRVVPPPVTIPKQVIKDPEGNSIRLKDFVPHDPDIMEDYVEENKVDPIESAAVDFYQNKVGDIGTKPVGNYKEIARELLGKTEDPSMRRKIMDILVQGNKNPYVQGGIITTVAAIVSGGILTSAARMGLTPQQTNIMLQAILNTVVPTVVSRLNGKSWRDTVKYTLASAGIGTGIAAMAESGRKK